jgi:vanillate/3-O-methylgallate O-demethylase
MEFFSLEQAIASAGGNPALMLRNDPAGPYQFPFPEQRSNWRDEQAAWATTATLFDQSFHMNDIYFTGPDVKRLLSESGVNDFSTFGRNRAKQFVAVTPAGDFIGDSIAFGFEDDQVILVGTPAASDWVMFRAATGDYDVEVVADPASPFNPGQRTKFRFQLQGPRSLDIIRSLAGEAVDGIKFFRMGDLEIEGVPIRALNHTMIGVPGQEHTGLEMTGPWEEHDRVLEALLTAGERFGMRNGGSLAYSTTAASSGWFATPVPAIYAGEELKPYREWLPGFGFEAHCSIGGSLESDDIRDYYVTPWDLGYGRVVNFDHEFVGRDAMLARKDEPHKKKVFLRWNDADAAEAFTSSFYDFPNGAKFMEQPSAHYATAHYDRVRSGSVDVGLANWPVYTVNFGGWVQLGLVDEELAVEGAELEVLWGNESAIGKKLRVEPHRMRSIRATVHTSPPLRNA